MRITMPVSPGIAQRLLLLSLEVLKEMQNAPYITLHYLCPRDVNWAIALETKITRNVSRFEDNVDALQVASAME